MSATDTADSRDLPDLAPHGLAVAEQLPADMAGGRHPSHGHLHPPVCSSAGGTLRAGPDRASPIVTRAPAGYSFHEFGLANGRALGRPISFCDPMAQRCARTTVRQQRTNRRPLVIEKTPIRSRETASGGQP